MKTKYLNSRTGAAFALAVALMGGATIAVGQVPHYVQSPTSNTSVQTVTSDAENFALSKIAGRPLRGADGQELGTVSDFLVDAQTGAVQFAVVPSGGGQAGDTFRLVPIAAIDANNPEAFTVRIDRAQWDQVGTLLDQRLQGRITLDADMHQRLAQRFSLPQSAPSESYVRVSQLKGQSIRSGNDQLGTIDDVLVDVRHQAAAAVIGSNRAFGGSAQRFMVPLQQLQFGADGQTGITTTLTRHQFSSGGGNLSPTGYASAGAPFSQGAQPFTSAGQQPLSAAAAAVQQAISRDQAAAGVQVVPEARIVLRGSVDNQQKKLDLERTAVQAAPGVQIENQITVRRW